MGSQRNNNFLKIQVPPSFAQEGGQPLFSPALPTALQHTFRPSISIASNAMNPLNLQTPLQTQFFPPPGPFIQPGHGHAHRGSIVGMPPQFAMAPPIVGGPMTPLTAGFNLGFQQQQHQLPPHLAQAIAAGNIGGVGGAGGHGRTGSVSLPFNRNRRQNSISVGGPPKATLGGPQNKHVAATVTNPATAAAALEKMLKGKKLIVKVPQEAPGEDGEPVPFARYPVPLSELPNFEDPQLIPDTVTGEIFPEERPKGDVPRTIDVFLPGKATWEPLKRKFIEERLEKLGVERSVPAPIFNHGVHGRAASISSPADPGLLMFKLNKLHQSQALSPNQTGSGHLSVSPRPQTNSPSPNHLLPRFNAGVQPGVHRHSMSLANPAYVPEAYSFSGSFNPFGPNAKLGSDQILSPRAVSDGVHTPENTLHAPRGVPGRLNTAMSRSDFMRGFGLDITEETEEELEEEDEDDVKSLAAISEFGASEVAAALQEELDAIPEVDESSRMHTRHQSRVSAALSLRSLGRGGRSDSGIMQEEEEEKKVNTAATRAWESEGGRTPNNLNEDDLAHEWTGSEDEESLGEFSNPSDEERAREALRNRRRAKSHRAQHSGSHSHSTTTTDKPRQLPNFPQPPDSGSLTVPNLHRHRGQRNDDDDIVSNPSEEERMYQHRRTGSGRPLPAIPTHSRSNSGQPHNIPLPHSRVQSGQFDELSALPSFNQGPGSASLADRRESLNPYAKPFVFGKPWYSSVETPASATSIPSPFTPASAAPSAPRFNATAPEFKPSVGAPEFKPSIAAPEFKPSFSFKPSAAAAEFKPVVRPVEPKPATLTSNADFGESAVSATAQELEQAALPSHEAKSGPGEFTFRPPAVAPKLAFPEPPPNLEPEVSVNAYGRAIQGREKRARKGSDVELAVVESTATVEEKLKEPIQPEMDPDVSGEGSMWSHLTSFKFPPAEEEELTLADPAILAPIAKPAPALHAAPKPFAFPTPKISSSTLPMPLPPIPRVASPIGALLPGLDLFSEPITTGITRSPKPPPLSELPRKSVDVERPISSANSSGSRALPQPPQRAQTLLDDYKPHGGSAKTVPASLFKKMAQSSTPKEEDEEDMMARPPFRARLSSRELFERNHRPSLDDVHMPMIARKVSKPEVEPVQHVDTETVVSKEAPAFRSSTSPVPQVSSAPVAPLAPPVLPSVPHVHAEPEMITHGRKSVVDTRQADIILSEKVESLKRDIHQLIEAQLLKINSATSTRAEDALLRIAGLMREQAANNSQVERRGEIGSINAEMIRNIVEDANKDVCASVQRDLATLSKHLETSVQKKPGADILRTVEEQASRVVNALSGSTTNLAIRLEAVQNLVEKVSAIQLTQTPAEPHSTTHARVPSHEDLFKALRPHLEQIRSEPFDVDIVTERLAEAVKPTLADFIDLASDKGETADLIVAKLAPVFATIRAPTLPIQEIAAQLAADVSRLVPPVDSDARTEQVADLVVERLNSMLLVRDKTLRPEVIAQKVVEIMPPTTASNDNGIVLQQLSLQMEQSKYHSSQIQALDEKILQSINGMPEKLQSIVGHAMDLAQHHHGESNPTTNLAAASSLQSSAVLSDIRNVLSEVKRLEDAQKALSRIADIEDLRETFVSQLDGLSENYLAGQNDLQGTQASLVETAQQTQNMLDHGLSDILHAQELSAGQLRELLSNHNQILKHVAALPEQFNNTNQSLQFVQSEFLSKLRVLPEILDLQNQRMELQVQLGKARTSHGQVRSEKEVLGEKLQALEADRERLRSELSSAKAALAEKDSEVSAAVSKTEQVDQNLQQALSRIQTSDAVNKTLREQLTRMEGNHRDLQRASNERQAKVDSLELQVSFANRDKESAQEALRRVEQERDAALEQQQESWREMKLTSQKVDSLLQLLTSKESDELKELRKQRERAKSTETELTNARKRISELESKIEGLIRSEVTTKRSLEDSSAQIDSYQTKVDKLERELEPLRRLDEAQKARDNEFEQIRTQLTMQEKEEELLRRNNATLQEELTALRSELELSRKAQATARWQQTQAEASERPAYSRASPAVNGRMQSLSGASTPRSNTPPAAQNGVWASRHAPARNGKVSNGYPTVPRSAYPTSGSRAHHHSAYPRPTSPAQSVVSQAPTLREDGWWE